jgi:hypothetical protein
MISKRSPPGSLRIAIPCPNSISHPVSIKSTRKDSAVNLTPCKSIPAVLPIVYLNGGLINMNLYMNSQPKSLRIKIPSRNSTSHPVSIKSNLKVNAFKPTPYESIITDGPLTMKMCFELIDMILEDLPMSLITLAKDS